MAVRSVSGVAIVLMVAILAACGSTARTPGASATPVSSSRMSPSSPPGRPTSTSGPPSGACLLLTQAQIGLVLGVAVAAGTPSGPAGCTFTYTDPANGLNGVSVTVLTSLAPASIAAGCAATASPTRGITISPALGVGDGIACFTAQRGLGTELAFTQGGRGYETAVVARGSLSLRYSAAATEATEKTLGLEVLAAR